MSDMATLPRAAQPFVSFATLLRHNGFLVAPEQTAAFLAAIELLGPSGITDIRRAGHATLGPAARAARGIRRPVRCAFSRQDHDDRQRLRRPRTTRCASARATAARFDPTDHRPGTRIRAGRRDRRNADRAPLRCRERKRDPAPVPARLARAAAATARLSQIRSTGAAAPSTCAAACAKPSGTTAR